MDNLESVNQHFILDFFNVHMSDHVDLLCKCKSSSFHALVWKLLAVWTLVCYTIEDSSIASFYDRTVLQRVVCLLASDIPKPDIDAPQEADEGMLCAQFVLYGSFLRGNLTLVRMDMTESARLLEPIRAWLALQPPRPEFTHVADKTLQKLAHLMVVVMPVSALF
jgi:hypothetical protein